MTTVDMSYLGVAEAATAFRRRELSPVELTRALLERIERLEPALHAFVTVTAERALADARAAEAGLLRGDADSPLLGVPVAYKDIYATAGVRTTGGSALYSDWTPETDAAVVARWQGAGTVMLGKLITHEFAIGIQHPGEHLPPARNPWNLDHIPGGSSSGSGTALAAGLCLGATGSDTGGSIRGPSANCGTTGLKPTYGRCSRAGVVSLAWSLDHTGPMARSAEDCALLLQAMAGHDPADPASARVPVDDYRVRLSDGVRGLRIGLPRRFFYEDLEPEMAAAMAEAEAVFRALGAELREVEIPSIEVANVGLVIMFAEAYAFHRDDLHARPEKFGRVARGNFLAGGLFSAGEYLEAQRLRARLRAEMTAVLGEVDLLLYPTAAGPAQTFEDAYTGRRPRQNRNMPGNLSGLPALALPCGFTESGLPLGMQLAGAAFAESLVLRAGHAFQQETDWHQRRPAAL